MTVIRCSIGDGEYSLEADGHAVGSPEACAGVSALIEALDGYLENAGDDHVWSIHERWAEDGSACFRASGGEDLGEVWRAVCIGLTRIALAYPQAVGVEWGK